MRFLVYEIMPNGSLDSYLHGPSRGRSLTWHLMMKITLDIERCVFCYLDSMANVKEYGSFEAPYIYIFCVTMLTVFIFCKIVLNYKYATTCICVDIIFHLYSSSCPRATRPLVFK